MRRSVPLMARPCSRPQQLSESWQYVLKIKEAYFYSTYYELLISRHSGMACVNKGSHSFTCHPHVYPQVEWSAPAFNPQLQNVAALWLVLISRPTEDRRLSWPGWLGEILRWFARPKTVTDPSICHSSRKVNPRPSSHESNALTTRLPSHLCSHGRCITMAVTVAIPQLTT